VARAAVKAKQQAKAKAQPARPVRARGRRRHSGGGNPNQQLFFMRLRRRQKWVFFALAIVFAATFAGVGVGSGSGGLEQLYSGLFGGGGNAVSKAQGEIKKNPAKGYLDLARAYETNSDNANAITALKSYLALKKKDAVEWEELGSLQTNQAQTLVAEYQQAQQAAQTADPSQSFQVGALGQAVGSNPVYANASQQATSQSQQLYQQAIGALNDAVTSYQTAVKIQPKNATLQATLASAATNAGNDKVALAAYKRYLKLDPASPQKAAIESAIKKLEAALKPAKVTHK
jgi:tetratricopeptide (TPR) repeat protein